MSERRWLPELDEHDRDLFEEEEMYFAWLEGRSYGPVRPAEGYDRDRDDPNGYVGADERERDMKGEL